ncbi:MAG TPA: Na(+)-translocating NADH-quinone reductase subunit B, partial [Cyclobacteriaceae bacterium]|nr:Na(+)-translocating NADH-quinone reductase subunit B [Cyclobacteriaceae bacterium]
MKFLRKEFDKVKHHFEKGGKWEKYFYAYEAIETFAFSPNTVNGEKGAQIRDAVDLKRLMMT